MNIPSGISDYTKEEKDMKFNLQWFDATTYTTTLYYDSGISAASASPTSGTVAKDA